MSDAYPARTTKADTVTEEIRLQGNGAAHPTRELGQGLVATRTAVGVFRITWNENPGVFVTCLKDLRAAVMANVKNCSLVPGVYDAANKRIDVSLFDSAGAARELAANEFIDLAVKFARSSV